MNTHILEIKHTNKKTGEVITVERKPFLSIYNMERAKLDAEQESLPIDKVREIRMIKIGER